MVTRDRLIDLKTRTDSRGWPLDASSEAQSTINGIVNKYNNEFMRNYDGVRPIERDALLTESDESVTKQERLNDFLVFVEAVQNDLRMLETYVEDLRYKHSQIVIAPHTDPQLRADVDDIMAAFKNLSEQAKNKIDALKADTEALIAKEPKLIESNSAIVRIRQTQSTILSQRLHSVVNGYSNEQARFRDQCKSKITTFLNITETEASPDEIEDMIERGQFSKTIMVDSARAKALLDDVNTRRNDILKIEKNIAELHSLFTEVNKLVMEQGEMINNIEQNVAEAKDYVDIGYRKVKKANEYRNAYRKKKILCCIFLIIAIIILIFVVSIYICTATPFC